MNKSRSRIIFIAGLAGVLAGGGALGTAYADPGGGNGVGNGVGNVLHASEERTIPAGSNGATVEVVCPDLDYTATGGGYTVYSRDPGVYIAQSRNLVGHKGDYETYNGKGWLVQVNNTTDEEQRVRAWVVCVYAPNDNTQD